MKTEHQVKNLKTLLKKKKFIIKLFAPEILKAEEKNGWSKLQASEAWQKSVSFFMSNQTNNIYKYPY